MQIRKEKTDEVRDIRHDRAQLLTENNNFFIREAYKTLRTNVMFAITDEVKSRVVMVTSSMPSEGKSTTSVNLAISLADAGKKTLLIDCDLRKPRVARLLNLRNKTGLSDTLFQEENEQLPLAQVQGRELYVMTSGSIPPNPSELLGSGRMRRLLEKLREQFDYIVLDTPPVNVVTDAVVLSPYTDGTVLVVRRGHTETKALDHAVDQLQRVDAKILGFAMNGVELKRPGAYGGKKYGYGYGYGYGEEEK